MPQNLRLFCSLGLLVICSSLDLQCPNLRCHAIAANQQKTLASPVKITPVKISPEDRRAADEYRQLGLTYRKQERLDDAIAALQKAVMLDPKNLDGRIILGWTEHLAKKDKAAAASLWEAIYISPTSLQAFNAIGIVYLVRGELPQAVVLHSWAAMLKAITRSLTIISVLLTKD